LPEGRMNRILPLTTTAKRDVSRSMNFQPSTDRSAGGSRNVLERNGIFSGSTKRSDRGEGGSESVFEKKK